MKIKNYILIFLCIICCIFSTIYTAYAETASGSCGASAVWSLDENGVLTIDGTGETTDYTTAARVPWYPYQDQITKVVVGEGITSIGKNLFRDLEGIADVSLPQSLENVGPYAFRNCILLEDIKIPKNVTLIDDKAFSGCVSLSNVELGESLLSIGSEAFSECESLTQIKIPKSVDELGDDIFIDCPEIVITVYYDSVAMQYCMDYDHNYTVICEVRVFCDSELIKCEEYTYGESYVLPQITITKEGHDFIGWDINSETYNAGDSIRIEGNLDLNAMWELKTYDIIFEANGGNTPQPISKKHGETIILPSAEKEGYNLLGWSVTNNSNTAEYQAGEAVSINANTVLYGVWEMKTYTIKFDTNGGNENLPDCEKRYWERLQIPDTIPTMSGYTFVGWGIDSEAVLARYQPGELITENADITLYAVWKSGIIAGDADNDGSIDLSDLLFMMKRIRYFSFDLTDDNKTAMDVFKDTYFNIKDVLKMAQYLSGWSNVLLGE